MKGKGRETGREEERRRVVGKESTIRGGEESKVCKVFKNIKYPQQRSGILRQSQRARAVAREGRSVGRMVGESELRLRG